MIDDEIIRDGRSPDIEGVLRRMIPGLPVDRRRNEIDVVRILGEAAPWVANVTEIVGPEHMAPHAPAVRVAAIDHLLHPETDLVEGRYVPARMMQSGTIRFGEGDQVMVARMRAVQEGDDL